MKKIKESKYKLNKGMKMAKIVAYAKKHEIAIAQAMINFILITFILISNSNLSAQDYFYRLNSGNPIKLNSNLPNSEEENNNPSIYCEGTESINVEIPELGLVLPYYTNMILDIQNSLVYRPADPSREEDDMEINSGYVITCDSIEECYSIHGIDTYETYAVFNIQNNLEDYDYMMEINEIPENIFYNSTNYKTEYVYTFIQPPEIDGAYSINGEWFIGELISTAVFYRLCAE